MRTYFWGIFLILSGLFLLIKYFFNLNISTARVIIGLFLVLLGIFILIGDYSYSDNKNLVFSNRSFQYDANVDEYNIIFSKGTVDLTGFVPSGGQTEIEINSIFGNTELRLPEDVKVYIDAGGAFGKTDFPDGSSFTFGDRIYAGGVEKDDADLVIEISTVFAKTEIRR
ncbi:MAG TPA: LiaF domain-containing protein [Bacillota bacterium]|nr:LiaF domain-containing protein [Bacillota bacterium]